MENENLKDQIKLTTIQLQNEIRYMQKELGRLLEKVKEGNVQRIRGEQIARINILVTEIKVMQEIIDNKGE